ncbi:hypothetical protein FOCC_FOCC013475, partial [Frankliniella occidentalis]
MLLSITVAVVILAFKGIVGEACFASDFTCNDGQCLSIWKKCNGIADCSDGADEDIALCRVGARNVSIGEKLIARVQYKWEFYNLDVYLCNSTNCTSMSFDGYTPDGRLCTITASDIGVPNGHEFQCSDGQILSVISKCDGARDCSDGADEDPAVCNRSVEIRLRGAGPFAFDSVGEGHTRLRIRPGNWISDMPVQFVGTLRAVGAV